MGSNLPVVITKSNNRSLQTVAGLISMPHSVPPSSPPHNDIDLPDAPTDVSSSLPAPDGTDDTTTTEGHTEGQSLSENSQSDSQQSTNHAHKANLEAMFDDDEDDEFTSSSAAMDSSNARTEPL